MPTQMKEEAAKLIDGLPDDATWDDRMYAIYVRQAIEEGIAEADAGLGDLERRTAARARPDQVK